MKNKLIILLLALTILIMSVFLFISIKKNKAYEAYLMNQIVNDISTITTTPMESLVTLNDVIKQGYITKPQAIELQQLFFDLAFTIQDTVQLGDYLSYFNDSQDVSMVVATIDNYRHFIRLLDVENDLSLTSDELAKFQLMHDLMEKYVYITKETLKYSPEIGQKGMPEQYWTHYRRKGVADKFWVNLIEEYVEVTDLGEYYYSFIND